MKPEPKPSTRHLTMAAIVGVLAASGCAEPPNGFDGPASGFTERDSAGVVVATSEAPSWADGWRLAAAPDLAVGEIQPEGQESVFFLDVRDVAVLPDGQILIAENSMSSIFVVDGMGDYVRTIGRRGDGPGEFRDVGKIMFCSDGTFFVMGTALSHFDLDGRFLGRRLPTYGTTRLAVVGSSPDCTAFLVHENGDGPAQGERGLSFRVLSWADSAFERADTLTRIASGDIFNGFPLRPDGAPVPWTPARFTYAVHGGTTIVGWGEAPEWKVYGPDGSLLRIARWAAPREPVTREDRDEYRERRRLFIAAYGDSESTRAMIPRLDAFPSLPADKPFFDGMMVDNEGRVWLRRWPENYVGLASEIPLKPGEGYDVWRNYVWEVFDPLGQWLGTLEMPAKFQLLAATADHVYGVQRDSLDVPSVRAFPILRPGDSSR